MNYVIIGNSAAAAGAIAGIRKVDQSSEIILFSQESYHIYSRPLISYYLAGKVTTEQMYYRPADYYEKNKVTTYFGETITQIDVAVKEVVSETGRRVSYDKLLIATGGKPIVPKIPGLDKENVHTFLHWDQVKSIKEKMEQMKQVVILGAGLIGLKAAEGLTQAGCQVTVIDLADRVLSAILDKTSGDLVQQHIENEGVSFYLSNTITQVQGEDKVTGVTLQDGTSIPCDLLIVAIGVLPNTDLVKETGIKLDRGILANQYMETSVSDIYVAGDVAQGMDLLSGEQKVLPLWPNAYRQGEVAGINMAGLEQKFSGGIPMNAIGFFGLPMLTAGYHTPLTEDWEIIQEVDPKSLTAKKLLIKDSHIKGFIFLNSSDRAGIYNWLMEEQHDISSFKEQLLKPDFGYAQLPYELRQEKLVAGGR